MNSKSNRHVRPFTHHPEPAVASPEAVAPPLRYAAETKQALVAAGRTLNAKKLRQAAFALLTRFQDPAFADVGLTTAWCHAMAHQVDLMEQRREAVDARSSAERDALHDARTAGFAWLERAKMTLLAGPDARVQMPAMGATKTARGLAATIADLAPRIRDASLEPVGGGPAQAAAGVALARRIKEADDAWRAAVVDRRVLLTSLHATAGLVYLELRRAAEIGRRFRPEERDVFAFYRHVRGASHRRKAPSPPPKPPAPTTAAAPTPHATTPSA